MTDIKLKLILLLDDEHGSAFVGHRDRELGLICKEIIYSFACANPSIVVVD